MDDAFAEFLDSGGVGERAVEVLRKEDILTKRTFALLHEEHMQRLLPKLTVGQHAIITSLWQKAALESEEEAVSATISPRERTSPSVSTRQSTHGGPIASNSPVTPQTQLPSTSQQHELQTSKLAATSQQHELQTSKLALLHHYHLDGKGSRCKPLYPEPKRPRVLPVSKPTEKPLVFQLGPLLYEPLEKRGVKRSYLPAPQKEGFKLNSTYSDIVKRGRDLFFSDAAEEEETQFWLTDSSGHPLAHFPKGSDLGAYFKKANPRLSKLRMYITYYPSLEGSTGARKPGPGGSPQQGGNVYHTSPGGNADEMAPGGGAEERSMLEPLELEDGVEIPNEKLAAIHALLEEKKASFVIPPLGPLRCVLNETQIKCLQQLVPAGALDTILVGAIPDMDPVKVLLDDNDLPVPDIGLADLNPTAKLYDNLPPLKVLGNKLLNSLPPGVANYLIDWHEIEQHHTMKRP